MPARGWLWTQRGLACDEDRERPLLAVPGFRVDGSAERGGMKERVPDAPGPGRVVTGMDERGSQPAAAHRLARGEAVEPGKRRAGRTPHPSRPARRPPVPAAAATSR